MTRIVIRVALNVLKQNQRVLPLYDHEPAAETQQVEIEDLLDIDAAINTLDEKYRIVLILRYYHDMMVEDISKTLEIPEGTVKTRLIENVPIVKTDKFDTIANLKPLKTDDFTFQVKEMNFSPATTQIIWYVDPAFPTEPEKLSYDLQLVDQTGRVYKKISHRGGSRDGGPVIHRSSFEPLHSSSKTLHLIPYDGNEYSYDDLKKSLLEKLPAVEVPLTGKLENMNK